MVFTTIGIVAGLGFGKPLPDEAKASEQWPQTQGEILKSELEESQSEDGTMYGAHVAYRYAQDGGEFESSRVWFGGDYSTSDRSEMFEVVRKYPVGSVVQVYYSPDNPAESVLMPGAYTSSYVLYSIGMLFLTQHLFHVVLQGLMSIDRLALDRSRSHHELSQRQSRESLLRSDPT